MMTDLRAHNDPIDIPPEIDRWNWGAFLLNWIWGVGNSTFIALLVFIPFGIFIMPFILGAKGSKWAWRNRRWDSIAHFKRVQRLWAIWGVVIWAGMIVIYAGLFGSLFYTLRYSEAYEQGASKIQTSTEAINALGAPISTGIPSGSIAIDGAAGHAALSFSATGPKASGQVMLEAIKKDGVWTLQSLKLKVDGEDQTIDLLQSIKAEIDRGRARFAFSTAFLTDRLSSETRDIVM